MRKCVLAIAIIAFLAMAATPAFAQINFGNDFSQGLADTSGWGPADPYLEIVSGPTVLNGITISSPNAGNPYIGLNVSWGGGQLIPTGESLSAGSGWGEQTYFGAGYTTAISIYLAAGADDGPIYDPSGGSGTSFWAMESLYGVGIFGSFAPIYTGPTGATGEYQNSSSIPCITSAAPYSFVIDPNGASAAIGYTGVGGFTGGIAVGAPLVISTAGWYTFTDQYYEGADGDVCAVLSVSDFGGPTIGSWTIDSGVLLTPGMGGLESLYSGVANAQNWYGVPGYDNPPSGTAIDNLSLMYTPEPISMIFFGTGLVAVSGYMARRKMARKTA